MTLISTYFGMQSKSTRLECLIGSLATFPIYSETGFGLDIFECDTAEVRVAFLYPAAPRDFMDKRSWA